MNVPCSCFLRMRLVRISDKTYARYSAALRTNPSCQDCHSVEDQEQCTMRLN